MERFEDSSHAERTRQRRINQLGRALAYLATARNIAIGNDGNMPPDSSGEGDSAELTPRNEPPGLGGIALNQRFDSRDLVGV